MKKFIVNICFFCLITANIYGQADRSRPTIYFNGDTNHFDKSVSFLWPEESEVFRLRHVDGKYLNIIDLLVQEIERYPDIYWQSFNILPSIYLVTNLSLDGGRVGGVHLGYDIVICLANSISTPPVVQFDAYIKDDYIFFATTDLLRAFHHELHHFAEAFKMSASFKNNWVSSFSSQDNIDYVIGPIPEPIEDRARMMEFFMISPLENMSGDQYVAYSLSEKRRQGHNELTAKYYRLFEWYRDTFNWFWPLDTLTRAILGF